MGLSLCRLGEIKKGINFLKRAIRLTDENYLAPYYDLAVVLAENNRENEAINVLTKGRRLSEQFKNRSQKLYDSLKN